MKILFVTLAASMALTLSTPAVIRLIPVRQGSLKSAWKL